MQESAESGGGDYPFEDDGVSRPVYEGSQGSVFFLSEGEVWAFDPEGGQVCIPEEDFVGFIVTLDEGGRFGDLRRAAHELRQEAQ